MNGTAHCSAIQHIAVPFFFCRQLFPCVFHFVYGTSMPYRVKVVTEMSRAFLMALCKQLGRERCTNVELRGASLILGPQIRPSAQR